MGLSNRVGCTLDEALHGGSKMKALGDTIKIPTWVFCVMVPSNRALDIANFATLIRDDQ